MLPLHQGGLLIDHQHLNYCATFALNFRIVTILGSKPGVAAQCFGGLYLCFINTFGLQGLD